MIGVPKLFRYNPIVFVSWGLLALAYVEAVIAKKYNLRVYSNAHTERTIALCIGHLFISLTIVEAIFNLIQTSLPNKPIALPPTLAWAVFAFLGVDFLKYAAHWLAHKVDFLWAEHAVHHAAVEFNFTTHLRQGWLGFLSSNMLVAALLCLVDGMYTVLIVYFFVNTLIQMIAHTQLIHKMGILETFLVTPSHHRVHHAVDQTVHDHNYGNVFIVWDKLFGTFQAEGSTQTTEFGLAYAPQVDAPLWKHAFSAWIEFAKDMKRKITHASPI